jgi:prepilin-type N-terminal cleavage/methylation domain-containing protein
MKITRHTVRRGFLLLEMILALAVFSIGATGFAVALRRMSAAAQLAQSELRITRILDSVLDETISVPTLEEGVTESQLGNTGIGIKTTIKRVEDVLLEDGQPLTEIYDITIDARWYQEGRWITRTVNSWRNAAMYKTT